MKSINRRQFLSYSFYAGGLLVAAPYVATAKSAEHAPADQDGKLTPLVKIDKNNRITFYSPSPEMGQGTNTALSMLFAEELGADIKLVTVEPLPLSIQRDAEGNAGWQAVPQFAGGSTSVSRNWPLLREAGATVRQLFVQAAAKAFGQAADGIRVDNSYVILANDKKVSLGYLAELAAHQTISPEQEVSLKSKPDWQIIGRSQFTQEAKDIVTGKPLYGMDMTFPDAKVALIARCPYFDGEIESLDSSAAKSMPGVIDVIELPRPDSDKFYTYLAAGVAVLADSFWQAKKARDALDIVWRKGPFATASSQELHDRCDNNLKQTGQIVRDDGDFTAALQQADTVVQRTYKIPLVSHAQLEPQNCYAHVSDTNCTVVGPLQNPGGAARMAEAITGFDRVAMDIRYTRLGGGFGRRLSNDHVAEAVWLSKLSGHPIKLIWTREDDLRHDFYRPMGHHQLTAGVDKQGKVIAWSHKLAGTPKYYRRDGSKQDEWFSADIYVDDFPSGRVANLQYAYLPTVFGAPQGSWRAPAHTANAFVVESFLDELASATEQDPLDLRVAMLGKDEQLPYSNHGGPTFDTGRLKAVFNAAAKAANWGREMEPNVGLGIAGHFTFGGYCACVAKVRLLANDEFVVERVFAAIDVGQVVNPEGVIAQVEGGMNDGLSTALGQQIEVHNGQVVNDNFDRYKMMRMADSIRQIDVTIMDSELDPVGAGEMSIPPLAPAVANAIKAAGGQRFRDHPMRA